MKKSTLILGFIILLILWIFFENEFGGIYDTPENALKHGRSGNDAMIKYIDTISVNEKPIIFYISKDGKFCEAEFVKKKLFKRSGWKTGKTGMLNIKNMNSKDVVPTKMITGKLSDSDKILFGVTKSPKANSIRINGKTPEFIQFTVGEEVYTLWYIIGGHELDYDNEITT